MPTTEQIFDVGGVKVDESGNIVATDQPATATTLSDEDKAIVAPSQTESTPTQTPATENQDANIPEKFKGKSLEEVIQSYVNLEKELGRKNMEVGELRKLVDQYLNSPPTQDVTTQATAPQQQQHQENISIDIDKLLEKPDEVIESVVENKISRLEQQLREIQLRDQREKFIEKHPDYLDVAADKEFQEWVKSSPIRMELYQRGDNHDYVAADELLTMWKELRKVQNQVRENQLSAAQTESSPSGDASTIDSGKIWSRQELIKMRIENPQLFEALQPEILKAYQEGRVK